MPESLRQPTSARALFLAFNWMALLGFGGVLPVAQHVLVEREHWLDRDGFLSDLAMAQALPGPNVVNMALMIGDRFFGLRGALAAMAGLLCTPLIIVLTLAALYGQFSDIPVVAGALRGMGIVAAGLVLSTALKLLPTLMRGPQGGPVAFGFVGATVVTVAVLRWPLVGVLLALGGLAVALAWRRLGP